MNREAEQLLQLQCAIFRSAKRYIEENYTNARFTLMAFPGLDANYLDMLKKSGIPILDMEHLFKDPYTDKKYKIPNDGHPSALANRELSEGIAKYIETTCKSMPAPAS